MMTAWLALLGPLSVAITLVILGLICRRFGQATGARPYYVGLFVGAALVGVGLLARVATLMTGTMRIPPDTLGTVLRDGLPALGLTLSLAVAWRYWSWLLADRE